MDRDEQWLLEEKYGGLESEAFQADRVRLASGEPLAYIIGHIPFLNCTIHLDSRPLIPRPETEYWTQKVIENWNERASTQSLRILDLCAGSGCIGVALAKAWPTATVTFAELDETHLPTIEKNIRVNLPPEQHTRCHVLQSDLFTAVSESFDLIVTNPPYVDPARDRVATSVRAYEPATALYGGRGGLALITHLLEIAPQHLTPGGELWCEHEPEQVDELQQLALPHFASIVTHTDQYHTPRVSICTMAL